MGKLGAWLKELVRDKSMDPPPPRPAGWTKTLDDLDAEKRSLSGDEIHWAREYEIEQLRSWARFPRDGDIYEAAGEVEVSYLVYYRAPYGQGGKGRLPAGTRIRVKLAGANPEPLVVTADPLEQARFEALLVPENLRDSKYDGYDLSLKVAQLNREFRLVSPEA